MGAAGTWEKGGYLASGGRHNELLDFFFKSNVLKSNLFVYSFYIVVNAFDPEMLKRKAGIYIFQ